MAKIRVDVTGVLENGRLVTFKAPCDCTEIDGLIVYHTLPSDRYNNDTRVGQEFTLCDSHGSNLIGLGNLFTAGALVHVILDTADKKAYVQNAATNSYIESRLASFEDGCKVLVDDLATHGITLDGNSSPQEIVEAYNGLIGGGTLTKVGTSRSFNITNIVGAGNIGNYTNDDFLVVPNLSYDSGNFDLRSNGTSTKFHEGKITISAPTTYTVNYNSSTGDVSITGGVSTVTFIGFYDGDIEMTVPRSWNTGVNVYLLV